jgi:membrane protease YdiL (CAAX protease family)
MGQVAPSGPAPAPRWWGTLLYVPLLYLAGFVLSRPLGWLLPAWRPDQVDLAGAVLAFALLLGTLPVRLRRVWGEPRPWRRLGLAVPAGLALRSGLAGLVHAGALLALVSAGLLLSRQAHWAGSLPEPGRIANALLLGGGVGLAEEILFRGWLWGELELLVSRRQALLAQAGLFALLHPWYRAAGLLALSLLGGLTLLGLGLARERSRSQGSLWGCAGMHGGLVGGWFLLESGLLEVSPRAPGWWAGPGGASVNPIGGLLGWIGLALLLGLGLRHRSPAGSPSSRPGGNGSNSSSSRRRRRRRTIRLVMMQKDEGQLLQAWVTYHAAIVGHVNLCIIDHGSTCPRTLLELRRAEALGSHVERERYRNSAFELKGSILETEIKRVPAHAWIPMDCDEFLCLDQAGSISCDPAAIRHYLQKLPKGRIYTVHRRLNNAPWSTTTFLPMAADRPGKVLMTTRKFHNLDQGSHRCTSREDPIPTDISFLHLHNRPFAWLLDASKVKLRAHGVNIEDRSALLEHREARRPCWHLCDHLLHSEEVWLERLHQEDTVPCEAFTIRLQQLGLDHPFSPAAPRRQGGSVLSSGADQGQEDGP